MSVAILSNNFSLSNLKLDLEQRFSENLNTIKDLGLKIVESRNFTVTKASKQTLAKYICTYKNWQLTIRDNISVDEPIGILGIYEIENLQTGEVYPANCNLKGEEIDENRFLLLKYVMDNGVKGHLNALNGLVEQLEDLFFSEGYFVRSNLNPNIQHTTGCMTLEKGEHSLYVKISENEVGDLSLSVSNSKQWSNPCQNRTLVKGKLFPLQELDVQQVNSYVMNFFNELETGKLQSAIPIHLFKQGYSWI